MISFRRSACCPPLGARSFRLSPLLVGIGVHAMLFGVGFVVSLLWGRPVLEVESLTVFHSAAHGADPRGSP